QGFQGKSTLARQLSSHTSKPASRSTSTTERSTGGQNMWARTPAPWTSRTGPRHGSLSPSTWMICSGCPSRAVRGMSVSRRSVIAAIGSDLLVLGFDGGGIEVPESRQEPAEEAGPGVQRMGPGGLHRADEPGQAE